MSEDRFVLTRRADEQDTVHRNPSEACITDDAKLRQTIDPDTADALISLGDAHGCDHCYQGE